VCVCVCVCVCYHLTQTQTPMGRDMMRDTSMMMVSPDSASHSLASPAETPYIDVSHGVCLCLHVCVAACVRVCGLLVLAHDVGRHVSVFLCVWMCVCVLIRKCNFNFKVQNRRGE